MNEWSWFKGARGGNPTGRSLACSSYSPSSAASCAPKRGSLHRSSARRLSSKRAVPGTRRGSCFEEIVALGSDSSGGKSTAC
eukprot:4406627-Prymnesium_polylepis.1